MPNIVIRVHTVKVCVPCVVNKCWTPSFTSRAMYDKIVRNTFPLCICMFLKSQERKRAFVHACKCGVAQTARVFEDFMRYEHRKSHESELDPKTLKGYKYLVEPSTS